MTNRQLAELIQLAVKKAVREELKSFKTQLLNEINSTSSTEYYEEDRPTYYQQPQQQRKNYSKNPLLNEILGSTRPLSKDERRNQVASIDNFKTKKGEIINVPTDDAGNPMRSAPAHVIEAMNRDYSELFREDPKPQKQKQVVQQQQYQEVNPDARQAVLARMQSLSETVSGQSFDNYEEDEDLSFLNEID